MTIYALPRYPVPSGAQFMAQANTATLESPFSRDQQTIEWPGVLWKVRYDLPLAKEAVWRKWVAFLARLRGAAGRINVQPVHAALPQDSVERESFFDDRLGFDDDFGFADSAPLIRVSLADTSDRVTVYTTGWDPSETVLQAGDFVSWDDGDERRLLGVVAEDAESDADGDATLTLAFPAPVVPAGGAIVTAWWPTCTMRLADDQQALMAFQPGADARAFGSAAFDLVEAAP